MADSAELSIDKAWKRLNVSREKQKIILRGSRKRAVVKELLAGRYDNCYGRYGTCYGNLAHRARQKQKVRITLDFSIAKGIAMVFLPREGGRLCFIVTSEAEENISC